MNSSLVLSRRHPRARFAKSKIASGLFLGLILRMSVVSSDAGSATWKLNPASGDWDSAANWTPALGGSK
jgi:hypothetical protein